MKWRLILFLLPFFLVHCRDGIRPIGNGGSISPGSSWLIPREQVIDGGAGRDGIPSIDNPGFVSISEIDYLDDEDLVLLLKRGSEIRVYPHAILDYHEVVNDRFAEAFIAVTYCPLTGTGIAWDREINGQVSTFGVTGLIYHNNLMPFDRETESYWSQMLMECVHGELSGLRPETCPLIEMPWGLLKEMVPNAKVLSENTGFSRTYSAYPYLDYPTNHDFFLFPVERFDERLPAKERVLALFDRSETRVYRFSLFSEAPIVLRKDNFNGKSVILIGSRERNFIIAYENRLPGGSTAVFEVRDGPGAIVMTDQHGNTWNIFGQAVSGPDAGARLPPVDGMMTYWFAWVLFYPQIEVVE